MMGHKHQCEAQCISISTGDIGTSSYIELFSWSLIMATIRLKNHSLLLQFKLNNGGINHRTTTGLYSINHRRQQDQSPSLGRRKPFPREMLLLNCSYLPLSRMFHTSNDCSINHTHCQVPFTLPYSARIGYLQEKMLVASNPRASNSNLKFNNVGFLKKLDLFQVRGFCSVVNSDSEDNDLDDESNEIVCVKSLADEKEVERVCNVIDELFALDRNMEAVLDECGVKLSHDLVLGVLERFRLARRPAFRFFSWAGKQPGFSHDSRTYNMMMSVLGKTKQFESMISLLDEIGEKGLLTLETFQICIKSFAAAQQRKKAVGIFELMRKHNFKVGVGSINILLDNLCRAKLGKEAQILFEKLKGRFTPNIQTYTVLLNGWCKVGNLLEAGKVWNEMIDKGLNPDIVAYNIMLEGLLKVHKRSDAVKLFEVMKAKGPPPNERSYTIMIRDLCKQKRMKDAVEYYENMLKFGCTPDAAVYTCLITGFGNQKQMDKVYGLLKEMKENGCPPDGRLYNALIKLMTNRQMPDDAVRIYKKMIQSGIEPTIHTYNMMLKSFFRNGNYDMGVAVWEEMSQKGVCPDDNSYTVFIGGLLRQQKSIEACKYLEEMIEKGMKPPQLDYSKLGADLSRVGKPNIFEELAEKMKLEGKIEVADIFEELAETIKKACKRVRMCRFRF
ncbi:hypothetical protein QVD17_18891 [Tagetes erecta]|uniref:Pentatricopeptide repeat-containing protein n=1 Tax=Tagetes erecta TaxID=13708 RepID=A0AAD8NWF8_TARER|nr:hypothetical protein QVD17_18891 [Tagetes erecta]